MTADDDVLKKFALTIQRGRLHRDDEPRWFFAMTHHPGYDCPWAHIVPGPGAALAETVDAARRHAAECRSSDQSGRSGEATPDDVSRETSSPEANCMRYSNAHDRHVWKSGLAAPTPWYQCDGRSAYQMQGARCREMETRTCPENRPCVGPCARFGGEPA